MSKKEEKQSTAGAAVAEQSPETLPAVQGNQGIATPDGSPSLDEMFAEDAGAGFQNLHAGDYALPFLAILQKGSPQVSKVNAKFLRGAEVGDVFNTVSGKVYKISTTDGGPGITFVPCGYDKKVVRWHSRDSGSGFVSSHNEGDPILKQCTRNEKNQLVHTETGDVFVDTAYHFGLLVEDGGFPEACVISMYSTQLKVSRNWNTTMRSVMKKLPNGKVFNPPMFSRKYTLHTVGFSKDSYDWCGWQISPAGEVTDVELYKFAREFAKQIESGQVRVSAPPQEFEEPAEQTASTSSDVPF
jgi:hypothetical protein